MHATEKMLVNNASILQSGWEGAWIALRSFGIYGTKPYFVKNNLRKQFATIQFTQFIVRDMVCRFITINVQIKTIFSITIAIQMMVLNVSR
jgi:hypothetical protein